MEDQGEKEGNICMPEEACQEAAGLPLSAVIPCIPNTSLPGFATLLHGGSVTRVPNSGTCVPWLS